MPDNTHIPPAPRKSKYGWPLPDRIEELRKLGSQADQETWRIEGFQGSNRALPILRVPINLPKYRISNGRTASAQQEWTSVNGEAEDYFDEGDPELEDIQIAQHEILKRMIHEHNLLDKFKNPANTQVEPLILDENGFVINGNRRLCAWRELYESDSRGYGHFGHVDVVQLPHSTEEELDRLEVRLQMQEDIKEDYAWHSEAAKIARQLRRNGLAVKDLAPLYGMSKGQIENLLARRELAGEYLQSRGKANVWSLVTDAEYAFTTLLKALTGVSSPAERELIKEASFALIDDSGTSGSLYKIIPKVREYLTAIKERLVEEFPIEPPTIDSTAIEAFGGSVIDAGDNQDPTSDVALVAEIRKDEESVRAAREIIVEAITSQEIQVKEKNDSGFLLTTLLRANTLLQSAAGHGLRPESNLQGVESQLSNIKSAIESIERWLADKAS